MNIKVDRNTVVVFDLDDTLYNELEYVKSAYSAIAKKLKPTDWKPLFATMVAKYREKQDVFAYLSGEYSMEKTELIRFYRDHFPKINPFTGVIELFTAIKENQGFIGIITDGRAKTQRNKIDALGLKQFIDCCVISEEVGAEKPNEENYRIVERKCGPGSYYYIADNLNKDFITPNRLGWKTLGLIDNGMNIHSYSHESLNANQLPHYFLISLKEITIHKRK